MGSYFSKLVWEFYASYRVRKSTFKHRGRVDTMPCLPFVLVRGQEVPIIPEAINSIYYANPIRPSSEFKRKMEDKENQFMWSNLNKPIAPSDQPEDHKSPLDKWCMGYDSPSKIVSNEDIYNSRPPPHWMHTRVVPGPGKPLDLPPDPSMSSTTETASRHFDEATYSWISLPDY
ncbi:hypothetical protein HAX54_002272 [Datura stramonium]|uniref:Uncharacterized protein n=1 Tax=Datura stramonium TaxID=4076 RepID=A0ABS8WR78_DATST|nr:hypothetical protein [Datura stramonium]